MAEIASLNIARKKLSELKPHPRNPRVHPDEQKRKLQYLIEKYSYAKGSIVVQEKTNTILAGHGIYDALKANGYTEADVVMVPFDDGMAEAFMIADNKVGDDSVFDNGMLQELINELSEQNIPAMDFGFNSDDLETLASEILASSGEYVPDEKDDEIPGEVEAVTNTGDLWLLGKHKVLCGDSTKAEDVERLMDGEKVDIVFTDPPYGVNVVGGGGKTHFGKVGGNGIVNSNWYVPIHGDGNQDVARLWWDLFRGLFKNFIIFGGHCFSNFLPVSRGWIIWNKEMTGDFGDAELAWTSFDNAIKTYKFTWNGLCREGNRKEEGKNRIHPTQKPVGLIFAILNNYESKGICDPFLGSGSTLIACEKLNRVCYGMEIDAHYCDVIGKRFIDFVGTSDNVFLERDGAKIKYEDVNG